MRQIIKITNFEDQIVIHFGSKLNRINAYTLATALSNLADAARTANDCINPGYDIEIVVESLKDGSFKAILRSIFHEASNLFSKQALCTIVFGVISNYIYQHTLGSDSSARISVTETEVIIEHENKTIIVPRAIHDKSIELEKSNQFKNSIRRTVEAIELDDEITGIGFTKNINDKKPQIFIPKEKLFLLKTENTTNDPDVREIVEVSEIQILRAILENTKRKWQFIWGGVKISAPILDGSFFQKFNDHQITIAPGDRLRVKIKIKQRKTALGSMYINESYEIIEVLGHIPQIRPTSLL